MKKSFLKLFDNVFVPMDKAVPASTYKHPDKLGAGAAKRKKLKNPDDKFEAVMHEFKTKTLHNGNGEIITSRQQALAIAGSESGKYMKEDKSALELGTKIESEHKETFDFIRDYYNKHDEMPPEKEVYKHIAANHLAEFKNYYQALMAMEKKLKSEKMEKARMTKYVKRESDSKGGYRYWYREEQEKKGSILSGIMSFFGFKDTKQAQEKVKQIYQTNKEKLSGVSVDVFSDYVNEYLSNKDKWDKRLQKKEIITKNKITGEIKRSPSGDKKTTVPGKNNKSYNLSLMKQVAGIVSGESKEKEGLKGAEGFKIALKTLNNISYLKDLKNKFETGKLKGSTWMEELDTKDAIQILDDKIKSMSGEVKEEEKLIADLDEKTKQNIYDIIGHNVFKEAVPESIQKDGQRVLDAIGRNKNIDAVKEILKKYQKDAGRDQNANSGAGPGKVKQARRGAVSVYNAAQIAITKLQGEKANDKTSVMSLKDEPNNKTWKIKKGDETYRVNKSEAGWRISDSKGIVSLLGLKFADSPEKAIEVREKGKVPSNGKNDDLPEGAHNSIEDYMALKSEKIKEQLKAAEKGPEKNWDNQKIEKLSEELKKYDKSIKYLEPSTINEYKKIVEKKNTLSATDIGRFPDLGIKYLKDKTGLDFKHDEELSDPFYVIVNGERFNITHIYNEFPGEAWFTIFPNNSPLSLKDDQSRNSHLPIEKIKPAIEKHLSELKEASQKNEAVDKAWQQTKDSKEGLKRIIFGGSASGGKYVDVDPTSVKGTFKIWGHELFVSKKSESEATSGYTVTEKSTGLKIKDGSSIKSAIEAAKNVLAVQGEQKFVDAIKHAKKIEEYEKMDKAFSDLLSDLQKAKAVSVGTVSGQYKKVAEGKWEKVKSGKKSDKDTDKKPDKDVDKKKPDNNKEKKDTGDTKTKIKGILKKMADLLADALSGKNTVQPAGETVEQIGENITPKGKKKTDVRNNERNRDKK